MRLTILFRRKIFLLGLVATYSSIATANEGNIPICDIETAIAHSIIDVETPLREVREFISERILPMSEPSTIEEWSRRDEKIRQEMLEDVVFRGEAAGWRKSKTKVDWLETVDGGPGYRIRKLRFEALPGFWIPALLYLPNKIVGQVPVVMNVNGHDQLGKVTDFKQIRCINQAKRGMIALNQDWIGTGQLSAPSYSHYRMNQLDLCGTSGLAPFYLAMERGLDVLLSLDHADQSRVAVTGLSGGGWQTILISSLDKRVTLANPVAGYSSFFSHVSELADLGDSEQAPVDMGSIADYCHLTAMCAPRPTLLTYNAKDQCCFAADGALPRLLKAAEPIYELYGKRANLQSHVNYIPGTHNFEIDNRLELYRMFGTYFFAGDSNYQLEEFPCVDELKSAEQLRVDLSEANANFNTLATSLAKTLPKEEGPPSSKEEALEWQTAKRRVLKGIVKATQYSAESILTDEEAFAGGTAKFWQISLGNSWTIPAVELVGVDPKRTVIIVADGGRSSIATYAKKLLNTGHRVLAVDPFYFGESTISTHDSQLSLVVSSVGERPVGIGASQIAAIARWARNQYDFEPVDIHAFGSQTSLYSLVAASLEVDAINSLTLYDSLGSLKEVIEQNLTVEEMPILFCFGLLERFDIRQLVSLIAPRRVTFLAPRETAQKELKDLRGLYALFDVEFDPLNSVQTIDLPD